MIKVYWKVNPSLKRICYGIQVPYFIIHSVSHLLGGNKRFKRRARSIFFTPFLVDMEEIDLVDVIDLPSFEITEEEFIGWLGMLGTDNVKSVDDLGWLLRVKRNMKVGWSGVNYIGENGLMIYYRFKVYTDSGDIILSAAASVIEKIYNKRRWKPDHIFWRADQYYKGDKFPGLRFHSYFEIDPEKLKRRIKIKDNNNS